MINDWKQASKSKVIWRFSSAHLIKGFWWLEKYDIIFKQREIRSDEQSEKITFCGIDLIFCK